MKLHPDKYIQKEKLEQGRQEVIKWSYNKILTIHQMREASITPLSKEMLEKLTKR
jgi:hypothetical protein